MNCRHTTQPNSNLHLVCLCVSVAVLSGCFASGGRGGKDHLAYLSATHLGPPIAPTPADLTDNPPDIPNEESQLPQLVVSHNAPTRPRVAPNPAPEPPRSGKSPEPIIAPEVPTQEMEAAKTDSERSLDAAEKNLAMASGRNLNPIQQDLASKVRGFSDNAREAMKSGDWLRAKNLSKKAEVLSAQLASSL